MELILVKTITYAMKGRDVLAQWGIPSRIERVPKTRESGCGYALSVTGDVAYAEGILKHGGVPTYGRVQQG